ASQLPFWFWNGRITSEGIREQVSLMASQGVGGFFIAPRQGLEVPYLSASWFDLVRVALAAADQHNMQVWIYDEYPYPSGMAGGAVTQLQPEARHRTLEKMSFQVAGGERVQRDFPKWQMLSLQAVPLGQDGSRDWSQCIDL
ncbi:glycosyl hydrolase, partial [Arthrospira platensis SPKY1]|nr:glycosyl hydrolase [Arthrospira platensis SPKY1]